MIHCLLWEQAIGMEILKCNNASIEKSDESKPIYSYLFSGLDVAWHFQPDKQAAAAPCWEQHYTNKDCSPVELSHQDKLLNISGMKQRPLLGSFYSLDGEERSWHHASLLLDRFETLCALLCKQCTYIFDFNTSDAPVIAETSPALLTFHTSSQPLLFPLSCLLHAQQPLQFCLRTVAKPVHVWELGRRANAS